MSWRIVVVSKRAKLEVKLGFLVIRSESIQKIFVNEISMLIIDNTSISMTAYMLNELAKHKIKIVFCDEKRNPYGELIQFYGAHDTSIKYKNQLSWSKDIKEFVWTSIVAEKIRKQKEVLDLNNKKEALMLETYIDNIEVNDKSNREGHAAKVYFNALFGKDFTRSNDSNINAALNYGYGILLSLFNKEVIANGYFTQLGLFHDNMFNQFNLSSDLMEPFRPLIDKNVINMELFEFGHKEKMDVINILNESVIINNKEQYVANAIGLYCKSIFDALNSRDLSLIRFYKYEF